MVSMRNDFSKQPGDTHHSAPQEQPGVKGSDAVLKNAATARESAAAKSLLDVHAAPTQPSNSSESLLSQKLRAPQKLSERSSKIGQELGLDALAQERSDLRQLRRLHDEGGLGTDFALVQARILSARNQEEYRSMPMTKLISITLSKLRSERQSVAESAANQTLGGQTGISAASEPTASFRQQHDGLKVLRAHTERIEREASYVRSYADSVRDHAEMFCSMVKKMLTNDLSAKDVAKLPEVQRFVRVLSNERALLQKDIAHLQRMRASYSESLMALTPRSFDEQTKKDFSRAIATAGQINIEDAESLLEKACVPLLRIEVEKSPAQKEKIAEIKERIVQSLSQPPAQKIQPKNATGIGHIDDLALVERVARLLAGSQSFVDVALNHPLYDKVQIHIDSPRLLGSAHRELSAQAKSIGLLLLEDDEHVGDDRTLPRLWSRLDTLDKQLTGKLAFGSATRQKYFALLDERQSAKRVAEQNIDKERHDEVFGRVNMLERMMKRAQKDEVLLLENLRFSRSALFSERRRTTTQAERERIDEKLGRIEAEVEAIAKARFKAGGQLRALAQQGGVGDETLRPDIFSDNFLDADGHAFDANGRRLIDYDEYFL